MNAELKKWASVSAKLGVILIAIKEVQEELIALMVEKEKLPPDAVQVILEMMSVTSEQMESKKC